MSNRTPTFDIDGEHLATVIESSVDALNAEGEGHLEETIAISGVANGIQVQVVVTRNTANHIEPAEENICVYDKNSPVS